MKLIALKNISSRLPKGTVFDEGNRTRARMLIHARVAAAHPDQPATPPAPPAPPPESPLPEPPPPAPPPTEPSPVPEPDKAPPRRSTRVGAHSYTPRHG